MVTTMSRLKKTTRLPSHLSQYLMMSGVAGGRGRAVVMEEAHFNAKQTQH